MNKYRRFETIGNAIIGVGMGIGVISASIDVEHSSPSAMKFVFIGCAIGLLLVLVGFAFTQLRKVEGGIISGSFVVAAWMYKQFHCKGEVFVISDMMVHKAGSYSNLYNHCYTRYISANNV